MADAMEALIAVIAEWQSLSTEELEQIERTGTIAQQMVAAAVLEARRKPCPSTVGVRGQ